MKTFLIATAALSLIGGAAFAQSMATPDAAAAPAAADPAQAAATPDVSAPAAATPDASTTTTTSTSTTSTMTPMASNAPAGAPPESYPICKSKAQDRCVNRSQATTMARSHKMKHMKTTDTTETGAAPAAAPGA